MPKLEPFWYSDNMPYEYDYRLRTIAFFEKRRNHDRTKRQQKINRRKRQKEQRTLQNFLKWADNSLDRTSSF